jgi:hypothetical protein
LAESNLLLAVVSPSYVRSVWCRQEWEYFAQHERELRKRHLLPDEQGLIFPVLLYPLDRGRFDGTEAGFASNVKQRQWLDVSSRLEGTPLRPQQLRQLVESLLDIDAETKARSRSNTQRLRNAPVSSTIIDHRTMLEWAAELSSAEMSIDEAFEYIRQLNSDGSDQWRLPSKLELEALIDPDALDKDSKASPYPLRPPFNAQRFGYLHSSTYIDPANKSYGNYVMNVRNGHLFNGKGYACYVRPVRNVNRK